MEPIAELEDDEEGSYDYDSPSGGMDSLSDSRNMMQFRSRSNTWPQFSSVPYDELASEAIDDDTQELKDKGDLCVAPYSLYDDPYRGLDGEPAGSLYSGNHLGQAATGGDFVSQHGEHTSTSTSTNLSSLHKSSPSGGSAFYSTAPSGAAGLTRASNHFSSRSDELDASPSAEHPAGLNGSHTHLHEAAAGTGAASSATGQSGSAAAAAAVAAASALKKNTSRRNAWGNMSYADLITQAINGSPEKRLTLSQIYEWMVQNVTYFKDKGDSNSSAGWKNSIRHNLSLHNRFMRVQNEGTGKSSWWMINPDAKPGKAARRRAISMETHNYEKRRGRVKRRVEQLRAAGMGCDPSALTPLSEYPLKSSEPSLLMSSSSGSSSYKLAGSTSSLLSPQTSLSNLCLADSSGGPSGANSAILVASPSSTDSYDPFSESSINVVNHFHSTGGNYSPGEFRPRASSNASSTCSTVNHLVDTDSHQVASLSPHHWNSADMCLYGSTGNSYGSGLDQAGLSSNFRAAAGADPLQLQLIDGLANLGTGSPSAHNAFRMMKEEAELMHKNGASVPTCVGSTEGSAGSGTHSEMMLLGADLTSGHGASGHSYNDLYKLQSTPQTAPISPSTSSPPLSANSSKPCFTSLDTAPAKAVSCGAAAASYFKSPSLEAAGKVHEINNNAAGGTATGALLYEYHRYAEQQRSASLANLAAYQHDQQQHPGKMLGFMYSQEAAQMGCYGAVYGGGEAQFSYYDYPEVSHGLNSLTYNSHSGGDLDLDFDTVCPQSGMLECDVDQVIRHELSVDGSLDFGLTSTETNADSTTSSTPTTPTTCSQNTYTMHTTERASQAAQPEQSPAPAAHSPAAAATSMDIGYGDSPTATSHQAQPAFYEAASATATQTYATLTAAVASGAEENAGRGSSHPITSAQQQQAGSRSGSSAADGNGNGNGLASSAGSAPSPGLHSPSPMPLRPATVIYGPYSPTHPYLASGHYLSVANPTNSAAVVVAAAAETAVSVSVTSPVTVSGHHQQPVASRSWVH